jgi:MFS superfamily sulfate permease-like transporter
MNSPSLARSIPAITWLRAYEWSWLRSDVLAGVILAAYLLPVALGDASLANLPPQAGLYACLFAGLVFWIFCGSRYTAVSVTSAISLVIGASLGEITGGNTARFGTLAAYLLPAALGDASLANLPPEVGLYACLFGGLVFWIFCGSRYTVVSVTSAISLVVGTSLGEITGGNITRFGALAAGMASHIHHSLNSPVCCCVSITLPASL